MPPRKINYLKDMKINEISLVTAPACPDADVLFTKADVKDEPRDERGRWTSWGSRDLVSGAKGAARELVRALSDRAKRIGEVTVSRTISAVRTTKPNGAYPVEGGGVQFDFEHTLNREGAKYFSSVQIRPEHVEGETATHRHLQRGLKITHDILSRSQQGLRKPFDNSASRFNFFSGQYRSGGDTGGGNSSSPTSSSTNTNATIPSGYGVRQGKYGMPVYYPPETPPAGKAAIGPAGSYNGKFLPAARTDVQEGIMAHHDWAALNPRRAEEARVAMTYENTPTGGAHFTDQGDYVPPGSLARQEGWKNQYARHHELASAPAPAAKSEPTTSGATSDMLNRAEEQMKALFPVKRYAEGPREDLSDKASPGSGTGHKSGATRLDKSLFPTAAETAAFPVTRVPAARAAGALRAEDLFFSKATFGHRITKSGGPSLDYVQRVAKSKIRQK
jgi:hypothetical protein